MTSPVQRSARSRSPLDEQTPALVVVVVGVFVCLIAFLTQTGHGAVDGPELLALAARVVSVLAGAAVIGCLLLHLCTPTSTTQPDLALFAVAATWAWVWVGALALSFALELTSPSSVSARAAIGPDAGAAAVRLRWLVLGLGLAALVGVLCTAVRSRSDVLVVLGLAVGSIVVASELGHGASVLSPTLASAALLAHVLAASAWIGGLLALVISTPALAGAGLLGATAAAYSRLALACYLGLVASGLLTLLSQTSLGALFDSGPYLALIGAKLALLLLLGVAGAVQRRSSLVRLEAGDRKRFLLLSGGELVAMATAVGLAGTLTHTASWPDFASL